MDLASALVGGLIGGTVAAIIGGIITLKAQSRQHKHERTMAQAGRVQDRRADAYVAILEHIFRMSDWVSRTAPVLGPLPDPPAPIPDEELWRLNAITAAHASTEVRAIALELVQSTRDFEVLTWQLAEERKTGSGISVWKEVEEARTKFRADTKRLGDRINDELAG